MKYSVIVTWPCRAVVEIQAPSRKAAQDKALAGGLPWDLALEDDDGGSTAAEAHDSTCPAVSGKPPGDCRCGVSREACTP